jgi:tetratricopeptide (TPR) repeat protein
MRESDEFRLGGAMVRHWTTENLGVYLTGALSEADETDCERHLARCDQCRKELAFLIRVADDELAPDEAAVIDSAEALGPRRVPPFREPAKASAIRSWYVYRFRFAALAAALILFVGMGWLSLRSRSGAEPALFAPIERTFEARIAAQPYSEFIRIRNRSRIEDDRPGPSELPRLGASNAEIGRFYLVSNNFAQAIRYLELAQKDEPASPQLRNDLGVAYLESGVEGSLQKALVEFQEALRLSPKHEAASFNLALVYERLGRFPEAEQRLKLYLQIDQKSGWAQEAKSKLQTSGR